jgi:hypothetical protein
VAARQCCNHLHHLHINPTGIKSGVLTSFVSHEVHVPKCGGGMAQVVCRALPFACSLVSLHNLTYMARLGREIRVSSQKLRPSLFSSEELRTSSGCSYATS